MKQFSDYIGIHKDKQIVVCGLAPSLALLTNPQDHITIGVNDCGRIFTPNYLTVLDNKGRFKEDRWIHIKESKCETIFTQYKPEVFPIDNKEAICNIGYQYERGVNLTNPQTLGQAWTSPFLAAHIAYWMGATEISFIGVDFTENHIFADTGVHPLNNRLRDILWQFNDFKEQCAAKGVTVNCLSPTSELLKVLPYKELPTMNEQS